MSNAKEKAKELIGKMCGNNCTEKNINKKKKFALIAVDEILESHYFSLSGVKSSIYNYWKEVKQEIEKL